MVSLTSSFGSLLPPDAYMKIDEGFFRPAGTFADLEAFGQEYFLKKRWPRHADTTFTVPAVCLAKHRQDHWKAVGIG